MSHELDIINLEIWMKKGELEAKTILEKFGVQFDDKYCDNNRGYSMPDLKYKNEERYLEVTHTRHNNAIYNQLREFDKMPVDEQLRKMRAASEAWDRVRYCRYKKSDLGLTEDVLKQYKNDLKILKDHQGYDPTSIEEPFSEFNCDIPIVEISADNVIREVSKDKGKKYPKGDVDLFIFVTKEEYAYFFRIFRELQWNRYASGSFNALLASPFQVIYVCIWDIIHQKYEVEKPVVRKLEKIPDGGIKVITLGSV